MTTWIREAVRIPIQPRIQHLPHLAKLVWSRTMRLRSPKRRRVDEDGPYTEPGEPEPPAVEASPNEPLAPATDEERKKWAGWSEIESEPVRTIETIRISHLISERLSSM
jgi:hypothetical protein